MHPSQLLVALAILALVAALMVCMFVDLERLRREVELDELWDDEVDADRGATSSSARALVATTTTVGVDAPIGGAA